MKPNNLTLPERILYKFSNSFRERLLNHDACKRDVIFALKEIRELRSQNEALNTVKNFDLEEVRLNEINKQEGLINH